MPDDCFLSPVCIDGTSDPDAEPDERETDGYADCLVQRVSQILRHILHSGFCGTHCRVSFSVQLLGAHIANDASGGTACICLLSVMTATFTGADARLAFRKC